jgi:hypothetical protein
MTQLLRHRRRARQDERHHDTQTSVHVTSAALQNQGQRECQQLGVTS